MPPDRRSLREIRLAYRIMAEQQLRMGQWAHWFRFNAPATTSHPTYDTGPERVWYNPITVPVLLGEYLRARRNADDDGLYLVDRLHIVLSYDAFFHSTMPDPDPTGQDHLNDRVGYDGHLFRLEAFVPAGRLASYFLTISVDCTEVAAEDLAEDLPNPLFANYAVAS